MNEREQRRRGAQPEEQKIEPVAPADPVLQVEPANEVKVDPVQQSEAQGEATPVVTPAEQPAEPAQVEEAPVVQTIPFDETLVPPVATVEEWADRKLTPADDWLYAAARVEGRWMLGQEITEREFDEVIERTRNAPIGGI